MWLFQHLAMSQPILFLETYHHFRPDLQQVVQTVKNMMPTHSILWLGESYGRLLVALAE
jgi:hypothetical protein